MGKLIELVGSPLKDVITAVGGIIDNLNTSGEEKLEAQRKLVEIERNFNIEMAKLDQQWAGTQADVIKTEAQSSSWLTRTWRPITMLGFVFIIFVVVFTGGYVNGHQLDKDFVLKILDIVQVGLSGYVVGRSLEKIAPKVTEIFAKK